MTQRLHVLLPDGGVAERVVAALRSHGLADEALHAVARHDPAHDLPDAGLLDTTDVAPAAGRGAVAGAATGLLAGLAALAFPPLGIVIGGGTVAASSLAGAGFGAWVAGMIGVSESAEQIAAFDEAIARGQVLLLIDVPADDEAGVIGDVVRHVHATADIRPAAPDETADDA